MLVGIGTNLIGIAVMLRLIRKMVAQSTLEESGSRPPAPLGTPA
jgi:hypothetical protein